MKNTLAKCNEDAYFPSLHLSTVELRRKLEEKLHGVTWPYLSTAIQKEVTALKVDRAIFSAEWKSAFVLAYFLV